MKYLKRLLKYLKLKISIKNDLLDTSYKNKFHSNNKKNLKK